MALTWPGKSLLLLLMLRMEVTVSHGVVCVCVMRVRRPVLAFHGTADKNIQPICETGFLVPGTSGFKHATDTGWYGRGVSVVTHAQAQSLHPVCVSH